MPRPPTAQPARPLRAVALDCTTGPKSGSKPGQLRWTAANADRRYRFDATPRSVLSREARLAALVGLWPHEAGDGSPDARRRLRDRLERALRAERQRGLGGHWTYDLGRHAALLALWREEVAAMRDTSRG